MFLGPHIQDTQFILVHIIILFYRMCQRTEGLSPPPKTKTSTALVFLIGSIYTPIDGRYSENLQFQIASNFAFVRCRSLLYLKVPVGYDIKNHPIGDILGLNKPLWGPTKECLSLPNVSLKVYTIVKNSWA